MFLWECVVLHQCGEANKGLSESNKSQSCRNLMHTHLAETKASYF